MGWGNGAMSAGPNVHAELAALVSGANIRLPAETTRPPADDIDRAAPTAAASRPLPHRLPRGPLSGADWHVPKRRRIIWSTVATLAVIGIGAVLLTVGPGRSALNRVLHRGANPSATAGSSATTPATTRPRPVPALAPAAAGLVHHVSLRAQAHCAPGKICPLHVTVRVRPAGGPQRLAWTITYVNRCSGARSNRAGGTLIAAPGSTTATATRRVRLPSGPALAVVALTTHPRAASAPLLIPASVTTC
jgi:hypothetical protein